MERGPSPYLLVTLGPTIPRRHEPTPSDQAATIEPYLSVDSGSTFAVRWSDGSFPVASNGCAGATTECTVHGDSCLCEVAVDTVAAFPNPVAGAALTVTRQEVEDELLVGAHDPSLFDAGVYPAQPSTTTGTGADQVGLYVASSNAAVDAIFEIQQNGTLTTTKRYYANKRSVVTVGAYTFRNPVQFSNPLEPTVRDALYEVEALLDHLHWHKNTAPFIAMRLIQRFTTSNPSPRYVKVVATAFRTGVCEGTTYGYGEYSSLGATIACVLLDREARSHLLDMDPAFGSMREPLLKVI